VRLHSKTVRRMLSVDRGLKRKCWLTLLFPNGAAGPLSGKLTVDGANLPPQQEVIRVEAGSPVNSH
jgi:hypothetical protein